MPLFSSLMWKQQRVPWTLKHWVHKRESCLDSFLHGSVRKDLELISKYLHEQVSQGQDTSYGILKLYKSPRNLDTSQGKENAEWIKYDPYINKVGTEGMGRVKESRDHELLHQPLCDATDSGCDRKIKQQFQQGTGFRELEIKAKRIS